MMHMHLFATTTPADRQRSIATTWATTLTHTFTCACLTLPAQRSQSRDVADNDDYIELPSGGPDGENERGAAGTTHIPQDEDGAHHGSPPAGNAEDITSTVQVRSVFPKSHPHACKCVCTWQLYSMFESEHAKGARRLCAAVRTRC